MIGIVMLVALPVLSPEVVRAAKPGELVVIGPFRVDELYESADHLNSGVELLTKNGGPAVDEMLKAMKGWKVHIIDRKVKEGDRWVWDRPAGRGRSDYPKILLEGRPKAADLKDKKAKNYPFNLSEWNNFNYHLDQGGRKPGQLAKFGVSIGIAIEIRETEIALGGGAVQFADCFRFHSGDIWYDVTGKYELKKPKTK